MAATLRQNLPIHPPDIRARFSTSNHDTEARAELEVASHTQDVLRAQMSLYSTDSLPIPQDSSNSIQRAQAALHRKASLVAKRLRPTSNVSGPYIPYPDPLNRTYSFNSMSTLQRTQEAASLSIYRDSPISAMSHPTDSIYEDIATESYSFARSGPVYTLRQARKDQQTFLKHKKREERQRKKAEKDAAKHIRDSASSFMSTASCKAGDELGPTDSPTSRSTKDVAIGLVKKLTMKRHSSMIGQRNKDEPPPPSLNAFSSKTELQKYLNPEPQLPAELPATLPPYTAFENSVRTENNVPQGYTQQEVENLVPLVADSNHKTGQSSKLAASPTKLMQCDSCTAPILMQEVYYQCSICDNGERLLCRTCTCSGRSCRHVLTEQTRRVLRFDDFRCNDMPRKTSFVPSSVDVLNETPVAGKKAKSQVVSEGEMLSHPSNTTIKLKSAKKSVDGQADGKLPDLENIQHSQLNSDISMKYLVDQLRELDIRRRDQELAARENDLSFRERDLALRQQESALHNREQNLSAIEKSVVAASASCEQAALSVQKLLETSACQTSDIAALPMPVRSTLSGADIDSKPHTQPTGDKLLCSAPAQDEVIVCTSVDVNSKEIDTQAFKTAVQAAVMQILEDGSLSVDSDAHVRTVANKRKASGTNHSSLPVISTFNGTAYHSKQSKQVEDEDQGDSNDEGDSGGSKRVKRDDGTSASSKKLFACPFCKYDSTRFSERNGRERHYRHCSSGYWPDISRLKQHLYRVHWRGVHCTRCFDTFDTKALLDQHSRLQSACPVRECPYSEKFTHEVERNIRRKRPNRSAEEVWYIIFHILFPDAPRPISPYTDAVESSPVVQSPPMNAEPDMVGSVLDSFDRQLDQYQDNTRPILLHSSEGRDLIRHMIRESVLDASRRLAAVATPASVSVSAVPSPTAIPLLDTNIPPSTSRSPISSVPVTPISGQANSAQWPLFSRSQSFSQRFPPRNLFNIPESIPEQDSKSKGKEFDPAQFQFALPVDLPTEFDIENDCYDADSGSFEPGDDPGLALTVDYAELFSTSHRQQQGNIQVPVPTQATSNVSSLARGTATKFRPVKLASIDDVPTGSGTVQTDIKPTVSNASNDSGYITEDRPPNLPVSKVPLFRSDTIDTESFDTDVIDEGLGGINYDALKVSYDEFTGSNLDLDADVCGNIGHHSLPGYFYSSVANDGLGVTGLHDQGGGGDQEYVRIDPRLLGDGSIL